MHLHLLCNCLDIKFITFLLQNISLGEWVLKQKSEQGGEVNHKFGKDQLISARSIISVKYNNCYFCMFETSCRV